MKILLDANVIVNYLTNHADKHSTESKQVMTMCINGLLDGYVAFHSVSIIWYSTRKDAPEKTRIGWIKLICEVLKVISVDNRVILDAADNLEFRDFEDNLQECCAVSAGCDYIVTVNVKDYDHSRVQAVTPSELVSIINSL